MAQFQLKLLTSTLQGGANTGTYSSIFLETPITEFYSQEDAYLDKFRIDEVANPFSTKNTFCYTYNEAVSLHQNAQKELTFSMDRKVFVNGAWTTNPFASNIHIGTQLLLIDKYDNEYIFIVKTIAYVNKENNLTYNVTCQDLFTYQMIRQNSGYTIANDDTSSEDYIGALTIDSWVVNYIVPDCFIPYTYLSLNQGLYIDTNGQLRIFNGNQRLIDVKKIIKPAYPERTYPDLYVPIPFSVSGSNADAALIALGEEMGLMLNTFERNSIVNGQRSGHFAKYFWFEPTKKSEHVTGLTYSPKQDIQDFSFSHAGDSLTTVLNVESSYTGSADEESVTLLPSIPTFFADYFESQEWLESKYYTGMFSQICRNKIRVYSTSVSSDLERDLLGAINIAQGTNTPIYSSANAGWQDQMLGNNQNGFIAKDENGATWVYIPLWEEETPDHHKVLNIPRFYDKIKFTDDTADSNTVSDIVLRCSGGSGGNEEVSSLDINFNDHTVALTIFSYHTEVDGKTERIIYDEPVDCFMNGGLIPAEFQGSTREVAIKIRINQDSYPSMVSSADISLVFYREPSQEEIEFATVADQCPWLENKLIDFRYFYDHNIISRHEYSTLLDILYNNLRIVNGRLLFYSQAYYEALHQKTDLVAKLTNDLDALGAACQADIIKPFTENGEIADDISAFDKAYELYTTYQTSNQSQNSAVIGWSDTINEYWNKYWGAEQRFLKNIYNFTNYFYAAASSRDSHSVIYDDTINLVNNWQLGFQNDDNQSDEEKIARTYNYITFSKSTFADIVPDVKDATGAVINGFKLYDSNPNSVTYGQPYVPIYNKDNNQLLDIVDATNYANYYVASTPAGSYYTCGNTNSNYKDWKTYYQYGVVFYTAKDTYKENSSFKFTVDKTEYNGFIYKVESLEKNTVSSSTQSGITEEKVTDSSTQYRVTVVLKDKIAASETLMAKAAAKTPIHIPDAFSATFELIPIDTILMRRYYLRSHDSLYCYTRDDEDIYTNQCIPFKDITNEDGEVITPGLAKYLNQTYTFAGLVSTIQSADSYILRNNNTYDQLDDNELDKFNATNFDAYNLDAVPIPPITDYYYYGPVYKLITTTTKKDGKEVITGASRVNAKGQTLADYQAYIEENSGLIKVENPETYQAYQKINYVTPNNESSYFRNVANAGCAELIPSAAGSTSVAAASIAFAMGGQYLVGILALGSYLLMTGINALCLSFSGYAPRKSGVCVADFYKNRYDSESKYFTNYSATEDLVYFKNESDLQDRQIFLENKDSFPNADQDMNYNFFEKVGFTYPSVSKYIKDKGAWAPIWYKTKWYRPIRVSDSINRYDSYKILLIPHAKEKLDENIKINQNNRYLTKDGFKNIMSSDSGRETIKVNDNITLININAFYHFPFNNNLNDIIFSGLDWATKTTWSLQDALRALGFTSVTTSSYYSNTDTYLNDYVLAVTYPNPDDTSKTITADLVVFIEETFRMKLWANKTNIYQGETLYQIGTDAPFNFEQQDDFTENLITIRDTASDFVQAHGFDPSAIYYRRYNYSYDRAYTVEQLKGLSNFAKYPNNTSYTTTNLTDSTLTLNVPVILTQTTFIKKGVIFTIEVPNWNGDVEELQSLIGRQWTIQFDNTLFDDFYAANFPLVLQYFSLEGPNEDTLHITFSCSNAEYEVGMNTEWKEHIQSIGCGSVGITLKNKDTWIASLTILKDDRWVINSNESVASNMNYNFIATSVFDKESLEGSVGTATIVKNGIEYTSRYSWRGVRRQEISGLTNGTFWYLYHNSTQYPTLMEKAAAIETQLQQYWGSAYNASLYCEYFLPEAWQSYYNSYNNHFSAILMKYNPTNNWVALNNKLIPHVQIVVEGGTADLPSYQFKFIQDTNDVLKDVEQRNTTQKQEINRSIEFLNAAQVFRNNAAVKNAMMALGEDLNNWSVQRLNATIKTTYYYADQGGLKWNNLLPTLAKTVNGISNYKELDGLYVMFYKIFRHAYSNRTLPMYESLMNEHNNIWKGIYESYPGVVLENTYTNEDATTSADLLNMARNYFADLSYPERQYNITVIDVAQLKGYEGQELQLGDPIAVNAFEYYDDYDEVYNTLSQYLFITDISYTLRKEGDINLTVNAIKYQDKLIRNLAKLIREPRRA